MLHEMNQMPDVHTLNVNDNFNGAQNNRGSVSYTHLDVYKRQRLHRSLPMEAQQR